MKYINRILFILLCITLLSSNIVAQDRSNDIYFKINKAFETYGTIFREVASNYVEVIDPDDLMENGIDGMLSHLDPYTVYYKDNDNEIDVISNGSYVGIGITVATVDSMLTIVGISEGNPASKSGLRIGDKIVKVDSNYTLYMTSDELRKYTKGSIGSTLLMRVLRAGINDTLNFNLSREDIKVKNVTYQSVIDGNIGYIKVEKFSKLTVNDIKTALTELKSKTELKGLIIDLRNNPGGLLQSAVELCEMFLPPGSPIVTTRSRKQKEEIIFKSQNVPIDTLIPLAILINQNSASASEIVAGAMQDLDRAVIVGKRSYGKGLVQSVIDLPFNASLKITTAKYYIPSGRCIQRINYSKENTHISQPGDSVFYTKNHRKVFESNGIEPDIKVSGDSLSDYIKFLYEKNLFFSFSNEYASQFTELSNTFNVNEEIIDYFKKYINQSKFIYDKSLSSKFSEIKSMLLSENENKKLKQSIDYINKQIDIKDNDIFSENSAKIKKILEKEIKLRFYSESELIGESIEDDSDIKASLEMFKDKSFKSLLGNIRTKDQN